MRALLPDKNMKATILFFTLPCLLGAACSGNSQTGTEHDPATIGIIGGADTATGIFITDGNARADGDSLVFQTLQCRLWYTDKLPDGYKDSLISMWTERPVYRKEVNDISVFVANPTDRPISYGREWLLYRWDGKAWTNAEWKISDFSWQDDLFGTGQAPLLHCFRFPVGKYYRLTKGKYRISKRFYTDGKTITLEAPFEVE